MIKIEIRISIDVPRRDEIKFQAIIDNTQEVIKNEYPDFRLPRMNSPIRVSIREVREGEA